MSLKETPRLLYRCTAIVAALFILTILLQIVGGMGDADSPLNRFLEESGNDLLFSELGMIFVFGIAAMSVDKRKGGWRSKTSPNDSHP